MTMSNLSIVQNLALLLARFMFVAVFIVQDALYNKILHGNRSIAYMKERRIPHPFLLLMGIVVLEAIAGLMIILAWYPRVGAMLLFGYMFFTTPFFHRFWAIADSKERQNQLNHFMKNISIMGGAIFIMVFGVGDYGIFFQSVQPV